MVRLAVFGDVDGRAAIFAADGHALQDAQEDERDGAEAHQLLAVRQEADGEGGAAHDDDGGEEGALAAETVAHATEDQRAEGAEEETGREDSQRRKCSVGFADLGGVEELGGEDAGQRTVYKEVVPFERRAGGGGHDNRA